MNKNQENLTEAEKKIKEDARAMAKSYVFSGCMLILSFLMAMLIQVGIPVFCLFMWGKIPAAVALVICFAGKPLITKSLTTQYIVYNKDTFEALYTTNGGIIAPILKLGVIVALGLLACFIVGGVFPGKANVYDYLFLAFLAWLMLNTLRKDVITLKLGILYIKNAKCENAYEGARNVMTKEKLFFEKEDKLAVWFHIIMAGIMVAIWVSNAVFFGIRGVGLKSELTPEVMLTNCQNYAKMNYLELPDVTEKWLSEQDVDFSDWGTKAEIGEKDNPVNGYYIIFKNNGGGWRIEHIYGESVIHLPEPISDMWAATEDDLDLIGGLDRKTLTIKVNGMYNTSFSGAVLLRHEKRDGTVEETSYPFSAAVEDIMEPVWKVKGLFSDGKKLEFEYDRKTNTVIKHNLPYCKDMTFERPQP